MRMKALPRGFTRLWKLAGAELAEPSTKAAVRHQAMVLWTRGRDAALVKQVFGVSRATLYRWRQGWAPTDPSSLEDRSSRPHRVRGPVDRGGTPALRSRTQDGRDQRGRGQGGVGHGRVIRHRRGTRCGALGVGSEGGLVCAAEGRSRKGCRPMCLRDPCPASRLGRHGRCRPSCCGSTGPIRPRRRASQQRRRQPTFTRRRHALERRPPADGGGFLRAGGAD